MRKLIYILFVFSCLASAQVNFSTYGVVGNGITDDTVALQAALDNESNLIASPGSTFKVTSTLYLDTRSGQTIDWNNSTMTTTNANMIFMIINKKTVNGGTTTMSDLLIDADQKGTVGIYAYSRIHLTNIDGIDYGQTGTAPQSPAHIVARYEGNDADAQGDWIVDGCDATNLIGYGNYCDYCDGIGAANGYLVYWMESPSAPTTITFKNATVLNGYGPDRQNVGVFSPGKNVSYTAQTVFDNITTKGFDRRGWKLFCGGITVKNCLIQDNPATDGMYVCGTTGTGANCSQQVPTGQPTLSAGLFTFGTGSGSTGSYNLRVDNTRFVGETSGGTDNRFILVNTDDVEITNCSFEGGADLAFTLNMGDVTSCNNTWGSGSTVYSYNTGSDTGNIMLDIHDPVSALGYSYTKTDITCDGPPTGSGSVIAIQWNNPNQSINPGQTVDLGHTTTPSNPTITGVSYSSSNTGVVSNAGTWVGAGTANLTITSDDTTNGTITDVMVVTANAADTDAPTLESFTVFNITENDFWATWSVSEYSKGWIVFGTTSDPTPPYVYDYDTVHENSTTYQTHEQRAGNNSPPLVAGTTYYCRIYMEDAEGNISYSNEFIVTTLGEGEIPPPDPDFESLFTWQDGVLSRFLKLIKF